MVEYRVVEYEKQNEDYDFCFCIQRRTRRWLFWSKWVWADDVSDGWFRTADQAFNCLAAHLKTKKPHKIVKIWQVV